MKHFTRKKSTSVAIGLVLCALLALPTSAEEFATAYVTPARISWDLDATYGAVELVVAGPAGEVFRGLLHSDPSFGLSDIDDRALLDGVYTWELVLMPHIPPAVQEELKKTREAGDELALRIQMKNLGLPDKSVRQFGHFIVQGGGIVTTQGTEESSSPPPVAQDPYPLPLPDVLHYDDVIITGSLCTGFDCQDGESFGFDTIRLKEHNLRINFQDTSYTATYPTNDWSILVNSTTNGGASYFAIQDVDGGTMPFLVEAGAPASSLYVEDYGRVGLGTSTPVVELHIKDSDTPTMRLEQDGSGGWTPQTWDVAGNESNFFIRDATNGSRLPFRIQPGAPSSSLTIKADGNVGIGTWNAVEPLHLYTTTTGDLAFQIENRGTGNLSQATYNFAVNQYGEFTVNKTGTGGQEFTVRERNDAVGPTMSVQGSVQGTQFINSSSRQFKTDFVPLDTKAFLDNLVRIPVTSWRYKHEHSSVRHVGPVAEDFKDSFDLGDGMHISTVDAAGVTMAAIQGLYQVMLEKDAEIDELKERIRRLEALVTNKDSH